jgi:phage replication-related protein YjqB (UPF0714/DUF867 family)
MSSDDKYKNFAEIKRSEGRWAYSIIPTPRDSPVLIISPHGGRIEPGTSELATLIAGESYNLYCFEGYKPPGQNRDLHITSHHFDEPQAVAMAEECTIVLGIHGFRDGTRTIYVGGRDRRLRNALAAALTRTGLSVDADRPGFRAEETLNICNRGSRGEGAQLELSRDLRDLHVWRTSIAAIVREVIEEHRVSLTSQGNT